VIVTDNLQQAMPAANATAFMREGELVERGPTTGMLTDPKDERTERDVSGKVG
jgi:phosphate transport system ATP-binding protein